MIFGIYSWQIVNQHLEFKHREYFATAPRVIMASDFNYFSTLVTLGEHTYLVGISMCDFDQEVESVWEIFSDGSVGSLEEESDELGKNLREKIEKENIPMTLRHGYCPSGDIRGPGGVKHRMDDEDDSSS